MDPSVQCRPRELHHRSVKSHPSQVLTSGCHWAMGFLGVVIIQFQWCKPILVCASGPTIALPMVLVCGRLPSSVLVSSMRTSKLTSLRRSIGTSNTNASLYTGAKVFLATEVFVFFNCRPLNINETLTNGSKEKKEDKGWKQLFHMSSYENGQRTKRLSMGLTVRRKTAKRI